MPRVKWGGLTLPSPPADIYTASLPADDCCVGRTLTNLIFTATETNDLNLT